MVHDVNEKTHYSESGKVDFFQISHKNAAFPRIYPKPLSFLIYKSTKINYHKCFTIYKQKKKGKRIKKTLLFNNKSTTRETFLLLVLKETGGKIKKLV